MFGRGIDETGICTKWCMYSVSYLLLVSKELFDATFVVKYMQYVHFNVYVYAMLKILSIPYCNQSKFFCKYLIA